MVERLAADEKQPADDCRRPMLGACLGVLHGGQYAPDPGALSQANRLEAYPKISSSIVFRPSARSSSRIRCWACASGSVRLPESASIEPANASSRRR